jgi:hypothetical protein
LLPILLGVLVYAVLLPLDAFWSAVAPILTTGLMTFLLIAKAPTIELTQETLCVGRAKIARELLGEITVVTEEEAFSERGFKLDARAYCSFQGSVRTMLKVKLRDVEDPTPYWLFSTRNPEELASLLS